jgi:DNA-binding response OmpR family regulator
MASTALNLPPDIIDEQASRGSILVIDDEPDIRESLETLLTGENYQVDLASNAAEGLKRLESNLYDLVLLDLMMPDKSGMQVLEEVRARDRETPIFMITAFGSVEVAVRALKQGANDYFAKPWDNEKLLIEIDHMISRRRLERENTELEKS